jgi:hypothetical protein
MTIRTAPSAIGLVLVTSACASTQSPQEASIGDSLPPPTCESAADDYEATVAAAFRSTVERVRILPAVAYNPQLGAFPGGEEATVCYLDGDFPVTHPSPAEGESPPIYDRAVLVVVGGEVFSVSFGDREKIPIQAP